MAVWHERFQCCVVVSVAFSEGRCQHAEEVEGLCTVLPMQWRRKHSGHSGHGHYTFSAKKALSTDPGRFGDEASCIHTLHYAPIQIPHAHAHVFLKVLAGVAQWRLSLTWEPEVERKRLIEFLGDPH